MAFKKLSSETLRKHKGVSFTGISTAFICYDGKGNIFLTKRSKNTRDEHGRWDNGAGGLKWDQSVEDNLKRELKEEYGVEPLKLDFIGYFDAFRTNPDGMKSHWVAMCFGCLVDPSKIVIGEPDMIDDSGWFTLDNLPAPLHSQWGNFMSKHGDKLKELIKEK